MSHRVRLAVIIAAAGWAAAAGRTAGQQAGDDVLPVYDIPAPPTLSGDAEIARAVEAANAAEVQLADAFASRAPAAPLKAYAERVKAERSGLNKRLAALARAAGITPLDTEHSERLAAQTRESRDALRDMPLADAERGYLQAQVDANRRLLQNIDGVFIPAAESPALKEYLGRLREAVASDLAQANGLLARLGKR